MISSSTDVGKRKSYASSIQTTGNGNSDNANNNYKNIAKKSKTSNIIKEKDIEIETDNTNLGNVVPCDEENFP